MNYFSNENRQQVLKHLFALATEGSNSTAIKLYLDLAAEQSPTENLTVEQALAILREAMQHENEEQ